MPEYMRVRLYLYNLMSKSDGKELQIPSENVLCRMFDVSRVTVRSAIQGLIRDKYLIPRRGIGTFINPEKIGKGVKDIPNVGVIIGDGRCVNNPADPVVAEIILKSGMNFDLLFLPDSDAPERLVEQIRATNDAVIWMYPNYNAVENLKYIDALKQAEIPFLSIETDTPLLTDSDSIVSLPGQRGRTMADYLFSRGHRNMLFVHNFPSGKMRTILGHDSPHEHYCRRMEQLSAGQKVDTGVFSLWELEEFLAKTPKNLARYSIIYSIAKLAPHVMELLNKSKILVPEHISYLTYGYSIPYFFNGRTPTCIDDESALRQSLLEWLDLRLRRGCRTGRFEREINMQIVAGETVTINNSLVGGAINTVLQPYN